MITVVGGTYDEVCLEPRWKETYGSGFRACRVLNTLASNTQINFYTFCDAETAEYLKLYSFCNSFPTHIASTLKFYYDHPLISPRVFPRPDTIEKMTNQLQIEGEDILYYGMLEGSASVNGKKVVYDPQSPVLPVAFSKTNSTAEELAYVINIREATKLAGSNNIDQIKNFFFSGEKASVLVLKMGPKGALISTSKGEDVVIPVYKTKSVWPIGSGDVFAAVFAHHWFISNDPVKSAQEASWQTACYCNSKDFQFSPLNSDREILPLVIETYSEKQVYLAGPFFTFAERWLIDQIRSSLLDMNMKVFSPWHDVGHGVANDVVPKDINALENSSIVFAILDGLDSGTLFEIGYAVKKGIPVIAYVENESSESVKMLEGTNCMLEKDLTTAIYKCFWKLSEHE